eukprot:TRINITY_DN8644_c0_g3_i1.p1 TRINITY_DN8644_c0_g3~~TRINITY_DN8644_c0_g3_i1.p1  ORF type:complete len:180 (+),score=39.88 TRINITY_DN8644_c0_g3_i1:41-541(+)
MHKNISTNKKKTEIDQMMSKRIQHREYVEQQDRIKEMKEIIAKKRNAQQEASRVQKIAEDRIKQDIEISATKLSKQLYRKQLLKEKSEREEAEKQAASWAKSASNPRAKLTQTSPSSRKVVHTAISPERYKSLSTDRYAEAAHLLMLSDGIIDSQPIKPLTKTTWR